MAIYYKLYKNNLTDDPEAYVARTLAHGTADMDEIIECIIRQGSTVNKPDILSVLEDFFVAVEALALDGKSVITPLAVFRTGLKGNFVGPDDHYEPGRHQVIARAGPGQRFRKTIQGRAQLVKLETVQSLPNLLRYIDLNSGMHNSVVTPGGVGQVTGHRLRFDAADTAQGVFFVADDDSATRVEFMIKNTPGELIFTIPNLSAGGYRLQVRAGFNGGEDVRVGTLLPKLVVS